MRIQNFTKKDWVESANSENKVRKMRNVKVNRYLCENFKRNASS